MADSTPVAPAQPVAPIVPPVPAPAPAPASIPVISKLTEGIILVQGVMLAAALIVGGFFLYRAQHPVPVVKPTDPAFVSIGRQYADALTTSYATIWDQAADDLDSGKSLSEAMGNLGKSWNASRTQMFDQALTPAFTKIIPESTPDANITAVQRQGMAKAWRGLAQGLRK